MCVLGSVEDVGLSETRVAGGLKLNWSSGRATRALTHGPSLQPLVSFKSTNVRVDSAVPLCPTVVCLIVYIQELLVWAPTPTPKAAVPA